MCDHWSKWGQHALDVACLLRTKVLNQTDPGLLYSHMQLCCHSWRIIRLPRPGSPEILVARALWSGAFFSWKRTNLFWKAALTQGTLLLPTFEHVLVHCAVQHSQLTFGIIRWQMDRHYHLLPAHRHQCASHFATYTPELVHLCDATSISTRQWRYSVASADVTNTMQSWSLMAAPTMH